MKLRPTNTAFTLIELLVVIAIIGTLAAMILPVLGKVKVQAQVKTAQTEIAGIVNAIERYHADYSRYPVSGDIMAAAASFKEDFTYFDGSTNMNTFGVGSGYDRANSEVIAILMDWTNTPIGSLTNSNVNHQKNPQQNKYLNAKMSGYDPASGGNPLPGVGADLLYRDPWGKPYIISMDLNYDEKCLDGVYRALKVSQQASSSGYYGLNNSTDNNGIGNHFAFNGGVMVWSLGPDKDGLLTTLANQAPNKDNVLSWK